MKSQLRRFNRHLPKENQFATIELFKQALIDDYAKTGSTTLTGEKFGGVRYTTIRNWLKLFGVKINGRGGPNNCKGDSAARLINAMDQEEIKTLTSYEIGDRVGCTGRYVQRLKCLGKISCQYLRKKDKYVA